MQLSTLWEQCRTEQQATRFIRKRNKPAIDADEFVNALYLYAYEHWPKFDPLKGDQSKSLEEQYKAWIHWQMRGVRTDLCRQLYAQYKWGLAGGEETKRYQVDAIDDVELDVERMCHSIWIQAYFEVEVEEVSNYEVIKAVIDGIVTMFIRCKNKDLKYQGMILQWMIEQVRTSGKLPEVRDGAMALSIPEWSAYKAWENAQNQIKQQLLKAGINSLVSRQIT